METLWALGVGVVSAVLSALLILAARILVLRNILPWYLDLVYPGIRVDGDWYASCHAMSQDIHLSLVQRAGSVSGEAFFRKRALETGSGNYEPDRNFKIDGRIQDRYLTLVLTHKNKQRIGIVSFLLEPIRDGRQLEGWMSFVSIHDNEIDGIHLKLARELALVVEERENLDASLQADLEEARQRVRQRKPRPKNEAPKAQDGPQDESGQEESEPVTVQ